MGENRISVAGECEQRSDQAVCEYLKRRGYEVVEGRCGQGKSPISVVALDEDCVVFVAVRVRDLEDEARADEEETGLRLLEDCLERSACENYAAAWLGEHLAEFDKISVLGVRFDAVDILDIGSGRILVKHFVNALGRA